MEKCLADQLLLYNKTITNKYRDNWGTVKFFIEDEYKVGKIGFNEVDISQNLENYCVEKNIVMSGKR